ncbi:MAG: TVP38/TMEM64 family protein [Planctomycetota bacterium]
MSTEGTQQPKKRGGWWKLVVLIAAIVAMVVIARKLGLGQRLEDVRAWIAGLGKWAPLAFIAVYVVATVAMVPGTALTLGAGALFGSFWGVVYVSIASTVGASCCFLISRFLARTSIEGRLGSNERFQRLDGLTKTHGWLMVATTRLVPLFPFNLLNYGFGLTNVSFPTYVVCSWAFMLPGTVLYVVGAGALVEAICMGRIPWALVGVVAAVALALAFAARSAARRLGEAEQTPEHGATVSKEDNNE